jgi:hypothetical protein
MHVHHKNGKKADNRESNLQCLCIACHAKVDDTHRERFSKGGNKALLDLFNGAYKFVDRRAFLYSLSDED